MKRFQWLKKKILCNFDPAALILSPVDFNKVFGLALAAPISSRVRGHAFETALNDPDIKIKGVVLCQQIKMIDFKERGLLFAVKAPAKVLSEVLGKSRAILS